MLSGATWAFVRQHETDDVRKLALQGAKEPGVDLAAALQQIAGWQTARRKLPTWAAREGIVYPPHLNMEQCSSEQTARYKAQLAGEGNRFVDLTGGFGVDFYWMSQGFNERIYVERSEQLCAISSENFRCLDLPCSVCCCDSATYLPSLSHASLIYLDPARRNEQGGRTYSIEDCTPNVLELLPMLMEKADRVMLKLSPMLDWRKAVNDLGCVSEVHIVSVDNECKELLLVLSREAKDALHLYCVNNGATFEYIPSKGMANSLPGNEMFPTWEYLGSRAGTLYLYEPNASIMKAGCFAEVAERFHAAQLSQNSHLFLSPVEIGDFPGRGFLVEAVSSMNKRELSQALATIESANISTRNFPLTAEQLHKKLKLRDGGSVYIFATTVRKGEHKLLVCRKIS